jgi:hypothetical protein
MPRRRKPRAVLSDQQRQENAFLVEEIKKLQASGEWAPSVDELQRAPPEVKRSYVTEAALHLHAGKRLPLSLAAFVADLVLAYVERGSIRAVAHELQKGIMPGAAQAQWIADWLLRNPKYPGRPSSDRPKGTRVAAAFYLRRKFRARESEKVTTRAIAKEHSCTEDYVRKLARKYRPLNSFDRDDLVHLLSVPRTASLSSPKLRGRSDARAFLSHILATGPIPKSDIESRAKLAGYSTRTLARAKKDLGISAIRSGKGWSWKLPPRMPNG